MDFLKNTSLITILTIIAGLLVLFLNPWREYKKNKLVVTLKTIAGIVIVLGVPWLDSIYREKNNKQLADIEKLGRELYSYQSDSSKEILKDTRVIKKTRLK